MKCRPLFIGMFAVFLAACSVATPTPTVPPAPTVLPSSTPVPSATPAPLDMTAHVKDELVNCRFGPGTNYVRVNELQQGQPVHAIGRNDSSAWLYIRDPGNPGGFCWLSASVVETDGVADQLPVQPPPFVTVTDLSLRVEPARILVNCSQFPQSVFFEAEVTANGPTLLTWTWEASTGMKSEAETLAFEEAGTKLLHGFLTVGAANDYWVKLHILTPNIMDEQVNFPVSCTP